MVSIAYELIFQTGIYADDCKLWRKKSEADQTWPDFKKFFTAASQDLRQSKTITESTGYHALSHDTVDITHTLNTITTAMESDRSTITQMTQHNQHLANQLTITLSGLGTATYNIASL